MEQLLTAENIAALFTLTALEIVLGIDNIVFVAILTGKLPEATRPKARRIGLLLAMVTRILLLFTITAVMGLTAPFFSLLGHPFSGRDLILLAGGLFLIGKATFEIHEKLEGAREKGMALKAAATYASVIIQIAILDIVFSLDSVITAVGMARSLPVMVLAIVAAVGVMMLFSNAVCGFIERHPTFKVLALSFLLLIGVVLVADGVGQHINKGYVYVAMAFSLFVEILNVRIIGKRTAAAQSAE